MEGYAGMNEEFMGKVKGQWLSFSVGSICTVWEGRGNKEVNIWLRSKPGDETALEFALPEECDLDKITDPSLYEYESKYEWRGPEAYTLAGSGKSKRIIHKDKVLLNKVPVPLNYPIILKLGDAYAAIKPVALRYVYEVKKAWNAPIIAAGGIMNAEDALVDFLKEILTQTKSYS